MLFKILPLLFLQGVLVKSEASPGALSDSSKVITSTGSRGLQLHVAAEPRTRPKRCTCYSYRDKECVYYCHLDIIWINTPERTVPYGMSSYRGPQRARRAVGGQPAEHEGAKSPRCICVELDTDAECRDFCLSRSEDSTECPALDDSLDDSLFTARLLEEMDPSLIWYSCFHMHNPQ